MIESEMALVQKLLKKISTAKWGGWIRKAHYKWGFNSYKSEHPEGRYGVGIIGLATVLKDNLLKVEIRLFYAVPYLGFHEFDKKRDYFAIELKLIDDLNRLGSKNLFRIYCENESEDKKMLLKIFEKAQKRVIFFDRRDLKRRMVSIKKILRLI